MKAKNNPKKLIIVIILIFIVFLTFYLRPHNYENKYNLDKIEVLEKYSNDFYKYEFTYNNIVYPFIIDHKYMNKRKLIKDVEIKTDDKITCIYPKSDYLDFYPLCSGKEGLFTNNIANNTSYKYKELDDLKKEYNKININNLYNNKYLIYNYRGFYYLGDEFKNIELYDEDKYENRYSYQFQNYLIVPTYEKEYYIDSFYIINTNNGKYDHVDLDVELSNNIRFLGDYKNKIYILDEKEEKEYAFNLKKKRIEETEGLILEKGKLNKYKISTIINKKLGFEKNKLYKYEIKDNKLFQIIDDSYILLSNKDITKIVYINNETIYYLVNDSLYVYNNYDGENKLMDYFEWNFHNDNIYIF